MSDAPRAEKILAIIIACVVGFVLSIALIGVPLAVLGWFYPWLVLPLVIVGTVLLGRLLVPAFSIGLNWQTFIALAAIVTINIGLNAAFAADHLAVDRDAGSYTAVARILAKTGSTTFTDKEGAFTEEPFLHDKNAHVETLSQGFFSAPGNSVNTQFPHLTASTLAIGQWIGGYELLTRVNALISAVSLLVFFVLLRRFVSVVFAVFGVALLGFLGPQLWFSRDTYSEPLAQLLILAGLLILIYAYERKSLRFAGFGGLMLGSVIAARVDGVVIAIPASLMVLFIAITRTQTTKWLWTFTGGYLIAVAVGFVDLYLRNTYYLREIIGFRGVAPLLIGLVVFLCAPLAAWLSRRRTIHVSSTTVQQLAMVAMVATIVLLSAAWLIRPYTQHPVTSVSNGVVAGLQQREGASVDGRRTYDERTLIWQAQWLTAAGLALGIGGAGLLMYRAVQERAKYALVLGMLGIPTLVYLWRPQIVPDQIWAMRRFVPATLPLIVLCIVLCLQAIARSSVRWSKPIAVALGAATFFGTFAAAAPVAFAAENINADTFVEQVCDAVGDDALVIVKSNDLHIRYPVVFKTECDIPVGIVDDDYSALTQLTQRWSVNGRGVIVMSQRGYELPGTTPVSTLTLRSKTLNQTLLKRPSRLNSRTQTFVFSRVNE